MYDSDKCMRNIDPKLNVLCEKSSCEALDQHHTSKVAHFGKIDKVFFGFLKKAQRNSVSSSSSGEINPPLKNDKV